MEVFLWHCCTPLCRFIILYSARLLWMALRFCPTVSCEILCNNNIMNGVIIHYLLLVEWNLHILFCWLFLMPLIAEQFTLPLAMHATAYFTIVSFRLWLTNFWIWFFTDLIGKKWYSCSFNFHSHNMSEAKTSSMCLKAIWIPFLWTVCSYPWPILISEF